MCGGTLERTDLPWSTGKDTKIAKTSIDWNPKLDYKVAELQLPAHNDVDEAAIKQFISTLPLPLSLEIFGAGDRRVMLIRGSEENLRFMAGKIQTLWPSGVLRILEDDPVNPTIFSNNGGERYEFAFRLGEEKYLPINTWDTFLRGDPMHTLLSTTLGLHSDEKVWIQTLLARKGTPPWLANVQRRLKLETQRGFVVNEAANIATRTPTFAHLPMPEQISWANGLVYLLLILFGLIAITLLIRELWLLGGALGLIAVLAAGMLFRFFGSNEDPWRGADLELVKMKAVMQVAFYQTAIRASVWAPSREKAIILVQRIAGAMSQYSRAGGNNLTPGPDHFREMGPWPIQLYNQEDGWMWLGPDEVAGLWHPPIVNEQVSPGLVPVRGVEIRSPDPEDVEGFYKIGSYFTSDGTSKPVKISARAMQHNIFCIGKPGAGKSTLMQHLCLAGMQDEERPAVIVIDPHGDLVNQLLGVIEPEDAERIRIFDVGDRDFTLPFNPLDAKRKDWTAIQVASAIVDIGQSLWADYWGPRMQIPLKRGVQLLAEANELRPRNACLGLSQLAALLNANSGVRKQFIANELDGSAAQTMLARYFLDDYDSLSKNFREQIIQPVLSKAYRFEEDPMLPLFSAPQSKLDLGEIIRDRNVLVINTGMNMYGAEISNFVGSLMINFILMELVRQGEKVPGNRVPVMIVIDEFQTYTGVTWAHLIQQMRKYGGRIILGTQSMASLRKQDRDIPEIILSGVYSLFAFNMNGDDAEYISRLELSKQWGGPSPDTLISLEPYKAYVRLEREDGRMSRPFYFESDPPPKGDELLANRVKALRAEYSFPYEVAQEKAIEMLTYFDRYGVTVGTVGVGSGSAGMKKSMGATSTQAVNVLLPAKKGSVQNDDLLEKTGLPWDVGVDTQRVEEQDVDPLETILGKEILDAEWENFLNLGLPQDNDLQDGTDDE
jgi:hypothetical protein